MLGLEIQIISDCKEGLLACLKDIITEIDAEHNSMYIPLNDGFNTEGDFSICDIQHKDLYDDWSECIVIKD